MGWNQLKNIQDENRQIRAEAQTTPPVTCPIDGHILEVNSKGVRNCPLGNYRWAAGQAK